jgi:uncharacterized OsmC-like protein
MANEKMVNGVDVERLFGTIEAVKENPEIAKFVFRSSNKWMGGGHNRSTIKGFYGACQEDATRTEPFVLDADEPPVLLGEDKGPNPVEFVLHALAACMTTSLVYHAAARGIEIRSLETRFEGDLDLRGFLGLDESVRNGYQGIRVTFKIEGDASQEQLEELVEVSKGRSPVFDVVTSPVPVDVRVESAISAKA